MTEPTPDSPDPLRCDHAWLWTCAECGATEAEPVFPAGAGWEEIADAMSVVRRDPDYAAMNHADEARAILAALRDARS